MNRFLGIDFGEKKIGLAISDLLALTAQPLIVINRKSIKEDIEVINDIVINKNVAKIVIGLPLNMDGSEGEGAKNTRIFAEKLRNKINIPIEFLDERLTTAQAEKMLIDEADLSRNKRKKVKDKLAACIILQSYLDKSNID